MLEKLSKAPRVRDLGLQYSSGWNETTDRKKGYFEVGSAVPGSWDDVILQGPHFTVANPFAKQPNPTMKNNLDWTEIDLEALPRDFIPRTSYQPAGDRLRYIKDYGTWLQDGVPTPSTNRWRIGWRLMAATTGQRTLIPSLVPAGACHTHGTFSTTMSAADLASTLGLWSSIVVDFQVKVAQVANLTGAFVDSLPAVGGGTVARKLLAERALSLVALTDKFLQFAGEAGYPDTVPARGGRDRRRLMVELDAIAALVLGVSLDELLIIYRTQFPVLVGYERNDLYDVNGRKVPGEINKLYRQRGEDLTLEERTWIHPQSGVEYVFEFPFVSYGREEDMRNAFARFEKLLAEKN